MGKFITLLFLIVLSLGVKGQVPSVKGQDDTSKMYPVNYEVPGKSAIKLNSTTVLLDTDKDNLLLNGSFEHQTATQDWSLTSLASSTASTSDVFEGKKKVCLSGVGSIFQMLSDTDKYHGRKFIARFNIQNPQGREGRACIYDGEDLHKCVQIQKSDDFVEYVTGDTFIKGKSYGVIVNSLELDDICVDAVSVKLDPNEAYVAEIEEDWQQVTLETTESLLTTTNLDSLTKTNINGNASIFSLSGSGVTLLRDAEISVSIYSNTSVGSYSNAEIYVNGIQLDRSISRSNINDINYSASSAVTIRLAKGDILTMAATGGVTKATILAKARSQVVVYPDETFSTDINPVYWKATACGENEIGCYNTYSYAANTNTRTLCTTRPDQLDADMRVNGIRIYTRNYVSASSCASPARVEVILPKDLSAPTLSLYKDTTREVMASLDAINNTDNARIGVLHKNYNPKTGRFVFDGADTWSNKFTGDAFLRFEDQTTANNGYLVIKASKTGAVLANKPPRELVKVISEGLFTEVRIYSDGWVEQEMRVQGGNSALGQAYSFPVPFKDVLYRWYLGNQVPDSPSLVIRSSYIHTISASGFRATSMCGAAYCDNFTHVMFTGYGAASFLYDNYGIKVNY